MNPLCIYHGSCLDGFAAATVVHMEFKGKVDFFAGYYDKPPPDLARISGREVFIVDFSYPPDVLEWMVREPREGGAGCSKVTVIDHHKPAAEALAAYQPLPTGAPRHPKIFAHFDMNYSGAVLTWQHFNPFDEPPEMLKFIQDRDLWTFHLDSTRDICTALASYPWDFGVWLDILSNQPSRREYTYGGLYADGQAIRRAHNMARARVIKAGARKLRIDGVVVPVCNAPHEMASEIGNLLAGAGGATMPFAATYSDTDAGRTFQLRSVAGGVDVSAIAAKFGGGGHEHAAGFTITFAEAMQFEFPFSAPAPEVTTPAEDKTHETHDL